MVSGVPRQQQTALNQPLPQHLLRQRHRLSGACQLFHNDAPGRPGQQVRVLSADPADAFVADSGGSGLRERRLQRDLALRNERAEHVEKALHGVGVRDLGAHGGAHLAQRFDGVTNAPRAVLAVDAENHREGCEQLDADDEMRDRLGVRRWPPQPLSSFRRASNRSRSHGASASY